MAGAARRSEQVCWEARRFQWVPQSTEADLERICRPVFGDCPLPTMGAMVEELPEFTANTTWTVSPPVEV